MITSGIEVTWTYNPTRWDNEFFDVLFGYEWEKFKSPSNAWQWRPVNNGGAGTVPEADGNGAREPRMLGALLLVRDGDRWNSYHGTDAGHLQDLRVVANRNNAPGE